MTIKIKFVDKPDVEDPTKLKTIEEFLENIPNRTVFYESEGSGYLYQKIALPNFLVHKPGFGEDKMVYAILDLESAEILEYSFFKWLKPNEMKIVENYQIVIERPSTVVE